MAVEIIIYDEALREERDEAESAIKLLGQMLAGGGPRRPSLAPGGGEVAEEMTEENMNDDDGTVVWQMPEMDPNDAESIMAQLGGAGSMGLGDLS